MAHDNDGSANSNSDIFPTSWHNYLQQSLLVIEEGGLEVFCEVVCETVC